MAASVVVDTGPIVALLDADEEHHGWAVAQLETLRPPLITCQAVLSEASFLMGRTSADAGCVPDLVVRGLLTVSCLLDEDARSIADLMRRYRNVPMSFADACLVRLVERTPHARLLTLDSDFRVYRQLGRRLIPTIAP